MTVTLLTTTLLLLVPAVTSPVDPAGKDVAPSAVRMVDLTGDGLLDKLHLHTAGISVSVNRDGGVFDAVSQELPLVELADALASDLDGDGLMDLYLVSPGENVALLGDGTGRFTEATEQLGLADAGRGISAERVALDSSGEDELLLHNATGDVIFWARGRDFRRDAGTPDISTPTDDEALSALESLVAQAAELLALDPDEQIVLGLDEAGRPRVALGPAASAGRAAFPAVGPSGPTQYAAGVAPGGPQLALDLSLTREEKRILSFMSLVELGDGSGSLVNTTIRIAGANLQIVNGSGSTIGAVDGLGNLIVGYNELRIFGGDVRTGSHNIIVGKEHNYSSFGGLVAGRLNTVSAGFASVSGGTFGEASNYAASVSGGDNNTASGFVSWVSGGLSNRATGWNASVSGGIANTANGRRSSVSGGIFNQASGENSSVSGGFLNLASEFGASVSGGRFNTASKAYASVSGGGFNTASNFFSSVSGGRYNIASGMYSSVSGGRSNEARYPSSSVSGGFINTAGGTYSSVSGGLLNVAAGPSSSVSGGELNTASGGAASVSGGNTRTAPGNDDWAAGSLTEDN